MKAAVVNKNHTVDIVEKKLRALAHGEALLKMGIVAIVPAWCSAMKASASSARSGLA